MRQIFGRLPAVLFLFGAAIGSVIAQVDPSTSKVLSQFDNGSIKGHVYENKLLGLRIKFPPSVQVDSNAEVSADVKAGLELLRDGKPVNEKQLQEMLQKDRMVFSVSIPPTEDTNGASLSLTIKKDETKEDLQPMVDRSIKFFTDSGKFKLVKPSAQQALGSLNFITFTLSTESNGTRVFSKVYATRRNGHLLTFSVAHIDEADPSNIETMLRNIEIF